MVASEASLPSTQVSRADAGRGASRVRTSDSGSGGFIASRRSGAAVPDAAAPNAGDLPERRVSNALLSTSDQARRPAEFKHINKRRKRNQLGFPE